MPLTPGTRLGVYEIIAPLGAGGMGVVYRARDTKLHREVAIKVLPEPFAADRDRLRRFDREAQALAALNHPHIAQVYGVLEDPAAIAMELVEGEDLAQRIARGPLPVDEALRIAGQIADALDAAHERGIVHRDLKPANIKVREDGAIKVLDFGLAKAVAQSVSPDALPQGVNVASSSGTGRRHDPANSPTFTSPAMTALGMVIGTAAYMAPEQAKGKSIDKRADIWAFGVVLYELLTGRSPFATDTVTETLGAVVLKEPDWTLLPARTPPHVIELLHRCLEKDPKRRLRDMGDAAYAITRPSSTPTPQPRSRGWLAAGTLAAFSALGAAGITWWFTHTPQTIQPAPRRFAVSGLSALLFDAFQTLTVSPDGSVLAYRGRGSDGIERIYVRDFHALEQRALAGTDGARMPFFSPDGQWIGFFAGNALKKIAVGGGPAQTIAPATNAGGGTWLEDDSIVFVANAESGVQRVPAAGGRVELLMKGTEGSRNTYAAPFALPGSKAVLLLKREGLSFNLATYRLGDNEAHVIIQDAFSPAWVPTGHVLFHQGDAILAVKFDPQTLTTTGSPVALLQGVGNRLSYQSRLFAVGRDGTLIYVPEAGPGAAGWSMVYVDREGKETMIGSLERQADTPRISPDGTRVAFRTPAPNCDIWVRDLARGATVRLTREGDNHGVVWRPDGSEVVTARVSQQGTELVALPADGGGTPRLLAEMRGAIDRMPTSWIPSTADLLVQDRFTRDSGTDVTVVSTRGAAPRPLLNSRADEGGAVVSYDGRLVAYVSDESGRDEIYLRRYSGDGPRILVSTSGGMEPLWSRNTSELFYRNGRNVLSVRVSDRPAPAALDQPRLLFSGDYPMGPLVANYDIAPDGRRFLMMKGRQWPEGQVVVVQNWFTEILSKTR